MPRAAIKHCVGVLKRYLDDKEGKTFHTCFLHPGYAWRSRAHLPLEDTALKVTPEANRTKIGC
jgi:hypothetical protein